MYRTTEIDKMMRGLPNADRASNDRLYPLVAAGNAAAREEMILTNLPLVSNKVEWFLSEKPEWAFLYDDLMSEGMLGLVKAVNRLAGQCGDDTPGTDTEKTNPTGLISFNIFFALGELIDKEVGVRVPKATRSLKARGGETLLTPQKESSLTSYDTFAKESKQDPRAIPELLDELNGCCESETERKVMNLRAEGRKDEEIAEILGLPKTTTYMMRRAIYARFLENNPQMKGEA